MEAKREAKDFAAFVAGGLTAGLSHSLGLIAARAIGVRCGLAIDVGPYLYRRYRGHSA
jgi:hypothetical protein